MKGLWERLKFDQAWYLAVYPDVEAAIRRGLFRHAFDHYWQFGRNEGRLPRAPDFVDEAWYLAVYPDVHEAIARGEFESARDHFIKIGSRERRLPHSLHLQVSLTEPRGE